jgi:hypothetical protein
MSELSAIPGAERQHVTETPKVSILELFRVIYVILRRSSQIRRHIDANLRYKPFFQGRIQRTNMPQKLLFLVYTLRSDHFSACDGGGIRLGEASWNRESAAF